MNWIHSFGAVLSVAFLTAGQVTIPARPATARFQSDQRPLRPAEIAFDRTTGTVTVTLTVLDPDGHFVANLHPDNFAVFDEGHQQMKPSVDVEHAPVTLGVLFESGGRYQALHNMLHSEVPYVLHPLFDALQDRDKVGIFAYADTVRMLTDLVAPSRTAMEPLFNQAGTVGFSEANLYDSLIDVLHRFKSIAGRKAVLLASSGLDTFSHATFEDVLAAAGTSDTPVYTLGLAGLVEQTLGTAGPLAKINWDRATQQLKALGKASGGRTYLRDIDLDVPAIYDDVMEHLRVRYVIRYRLPNAAAGTPRTVRVALVNPKTGMPLKITDATGKTVTANVSLEATYTP